jgi:hypothetical protein
MLPIDSGTPYQRVTSHKECFADNLHLASYAASRPAGWSTITPSVERWRTGVERWRTPLGAALSALTLAPSSDVVAPARTYSSVCPRRCT